eukprot:jgi/Botrbrau1/10643/Bobra.53_2s0002.1
MTGLTSAPLPVNCLPLQEKRPEEPGSGQGTAPEDPAEESVAPGQGTAPKDPEEAEDKNKAKCDLLNWHCANLEFANASLVSSLSMRYWDQDDPYELHGAHCFIPGGNIRLVSALTEGLPILYNSVVREVRYSAAGVAVRTDLHEFTGDAVVVTVPLGVLKRDIIKFEPPLPPRKVEAIQRVNFGVLNKVVLLFPRAFWGNCDMFGYVNSDPDRRGDFFLFYSYAHLAGGPLLASLISGKAALDYEDQKPKDAVVRVMRVLRRIFEPKGIPVPMPVQACCTRWGTDPMTFGSYSSLGVGSLGGEDYDTLAESLSGRVFFAGEATTRKYPATMHGAFHTGLREAANVSATFAKMQAEAMTAGLAKNAKPGVVYNQELMCKATETLDLSKRLAELFAARGCRPDVEFGCFSAVFGPPGSGLEGEALLRVDIGNAQQGGHRRSLPIFLAVSRDAVFRLQDTEGGDSARFTVLQGMPSLKAVGRNQVDSRVERLAHAILYRKVPRGRAPTKGPSAEPSSASAVPGAAPQPPAAVQGLQPGLPAVKPETSGAPKGPVSGAAKPISTSAQSLQTALTALSAHGKAARGGGQRRAGQGSTSRRPSAGAPRTSQQSFSHRPPHPMVTPLQQGTAQPLGAHLGVGAGGTNGAVPSSTHWQTGATGPSGYQAFSGAPGLIPQPGGQQGITGSVVQGPVVQSGTQYPGGSVLGLPYGAQQGPFAPAAPQQALHQAGPQCAAPQAANQNLPAQQAVHMQPAPPSANAAQYPAGQLFQYRPQGQPSAAVMQLPSQPQAQVDAGQTCMADFQQRAMGVPGPGLFQQQQQQQQNQQYQPQGAIPLGGSFQYQAQGAVQMEGSPGTGAPGPQGGPFQGAVQNGGSQVGPGPAPQGARPLGGSMGIQAAPSQGAVPLGDPVFSTVPGHQGGPVQGAVAMGGPMFMPGPGPQGVPSQGPVPLGAPAYMLDNGPQGPQEKGVPLAGPVFAQGPGLQGGPFQAAVPLGSSGVFQGPGPHGGPSQGAVPLGGPVFMPGPTPQGGSGQGYIPR